jgi:CRISPR-associated protein Cmr2
MTDYWQHKLSLWLHDPAHKMFDIRRHESLAEEIATLLHVTTPDKDTYQKSDMMASGLARAALPGYNSDKAQNGAVDFKSQAIITHPLVADCQLRLAVDNVSVDHIHDELQKLLKRDLGLDKTIEELQAIPEEERPLSGFFNRRNTPEEWARALYFYLFFALKKRLRQENVGGLGGAWELLPADSRMPDHPLWHHLGLTSAIGSALATDPDDKIALAVFSITPVQPFIGKARKLRDHWTGSVILSYLAFSGIRYIAETLGPDHIIYPSLQAQSLVEAWLGDDKSFHLKRFLREDEALTEIDKKSASIASFPNKFVFLCPAAKTAKICKEIEKAVQTEWLRIAQLARDSLVRKTRSGETMRKLFDHQIKDYWQFSHAACHLVGLSDKDFLGQAQHQGKWQTEYKTVAAFAQAYGQSGQAVARLYEASHTLAQSVLAAAKLKPARIRQAQDGEKCPLCGEHEVLHDFATTGTTSAKAYSEAARAFWDSVREAENGQDGYAQVGKNERLCAICAVKRFLPGVMRRARQPQELLATVFAEADDFPSTTAIAATRYFRELTERVAITNTKEKHKKLVNWFNASELDPADDEHSQAMREIVKAGKDQDVRYSDRDKYYALLLMDGDKMGDLVGGKTLSATWGDVIHPDLRGRFDKPGFHSQSPLRPRLSEKRLLNPALHAAISDALNSFARYGVAPVIERLSGRLIYAGGDDVCAILPLDSALEAADAIRRSYTMGFVRYGANGATELKGICPPAPGKLGMHLGKAEKISISAAIVIAHHKTPLRETLRDAHAVLSDIAKERAGRNALAIRLAKRSGGDRDLWLQWDANNPFCTDGDESILSSLQRLMQGVKDDLLSGSLLYRLAELEQSVRPLVTAKPEALSADTKKNIVSLARYEVGHSGKLIPKDQQGPFAERLAGLMIRDAAGQADWFNPEAAIIARFLAKSLARRKA